MGGPQRRPHPGHPPGLVPPLLHATPEQPEHYEISGGGAGLHGDDLVEDISVAGLLAGHGDQTYPVREAA